MIGRVVSVGPGGTFGFLRTDDGRHRRVFLAGSAMPRGMSIEVGMMLRFDLVDSDPRGPSATNVVALDTDGNWPPAA